MKYFRRFMNIALVLLCMMVFTACGKELPYPEITLTESDLENKFHYSLIENEANKLIYKELYEGFMNQSEEIYLHGNEGTPLWALVEFVLDDYPEIFWCDADTDMTYESRGFWGEEYLIVYPEYPYSKEEVEKRKQEMEAMTEECIEACKEKKSDYEKVKYVYEYIIDTVEYVDDAPDNQNLYSSLVSKKSVCAGYAQGVQYLLERAGVWCNTVGGQALDENDKFGGHAWNIVQCDDEYYYVDATWGDSEENESEKSEEKAVEPRDYEYLCCSADELEDTHKADHEEKLPECSSEKLNYYRKNGMYYENLNEEKLMGAMKESIADKERYTTFKFQNEEDYKEALEVLEEELLDDALQYLAGYYGLSKSNCTYSYYDDYWKIHVYWEYK